MAGTVIADRLEAASTSQLVIENGVALTPPTIADVNGVAIGTFCRAWVNFNGTGTVAIRASFNVSSITDNGVGNYTVNFTTAMPDANYAVTANAKITNAQNAGSSNEPLTVGPNSWLTSSVGVASNYATTPNDPATMSVAIFR